MERRKITDKVKSEISKKENSKLTKKGKRENLRDFKEGENMERNKTTDKVRNKVLRYLKGK